MEGGLANADHWRAGETPCGIKAGVVKIRDNVRVHIGRLADLGDQARHRERLIVIAFNAGRAEIRIDRHNLRARRGDPQRRIVELARHRAGGVRINNKDAHRSGVTWR